MVAGRWRRGKIATCDVLSRFFNGIVKIKIGRLVHEQIIVAILVAAAEIDDIVVVRVWDNAMRLRVLRQFLVSSPGIIHQPQDLATIPSDFVVVNTWQGGQFREVCANVSIIPICN